MKQLRILTIIAVVCYFAVQWPAFTVQAPGGGDREIVGACAGQLKDHIEALTSIRPFRFYQNPDSLDKAADYIFKTFKRATPRVVRQRFQVKRKGFKEYLYQNVIASFGPKTGERIILGAHYDACGPQPAADDNATGVAAVLELARILNKKKPQLKYRVDLVAYTLEEPPFFRTQFMGSAVHARSLAETKAKVRLMISVDMIGYFDPDGEIGDFFPGFIKPVDVEPGNTTAIIGKIEKAETTNSICNIMMNHCRVKVLALNLPPGTGGMDFSDHLNYWNHGYPAIMISNFPVCNNPAYHQPEDTIEKLDFSKIAEIVHGLYAVAVGF